jgi:anthranilate synthase component 2
MEVVRELGPRLPLFGVCMGHQCIGEVFGGRVVRAPCGVMHGKVSPVTHTNVGLLEVRPGAGRRELFECHDGSVAH